MRRKLFDIKYIISFILYFLSYNKKIHLSIPSGSFYMQLSQTHPTLRPGPIIANEANRFETKARPDRARRQRLTSFPKRKQFPYRAGDCRAVPAERLFITQSVIKSFCCLMTSQRYARIAREHLFCERATILVKATFEGTRFLDSHLQMW